MIVVAIVSESQRARFEISLREATCTIVLKQSPRALRGLMLFEGVICRPIESRASASNRRPGLEKCAARLIYSPGSGSSGGNEWRRLAKRRDRLVIANAHA